ncbi:MAG: tRNA (adenosine(37)-N6)-threonylcarbamoyltransferase complex dimerization subunit type 1 TsaB [Cytophagales bacterium]|nr:tRNA (adenosine(37)-N6)-threonylcarbamoyltransferase complex dimerization subunit type 1 TsaB [Cytophagales bacterium]
MATIVSLETATKVCSVALHQEGKLVAAQTYHLEKSHSSLLPLIIKQMLENCELTLESVDAFAVSSGPGSYTGLRIGATTTKGLAFTLNKPLISVNTLEAMLQGMKSTIDAPAYFCPMIDARRMEAYCILADANRTYWETNPLIVEPDSFTKFTDKPIYLFGDGAAKTREVLTQKNIKWIADVYPSAEHVGILAEEKFQNSEFEDVAYFEPFYLKEFQAKPAKTLV